MGGWVWVVYVHLHIYTRAWICKLLSASCWLLLLTDSYLLTLSHSRPPPQKKVDRLVNQSYQNWAPRVQEAAYGQTPGAVVLSTEGEGEGEAGQYELRPTTVRCVSCLCL